MDRSVAKDINLFMSVPDNKQNLSGSITEIFQIINSDDNKSLDLINKKGSVFEDPSIKKTFDSLSDEEKEKYKKIGEQVHSVDYEKISKYGVEYDNALAYIVMSLNSGLHPSYLNNDNKTILKTEFGDKWFEKFGYEVKDLYIKPAMKSSPLSDDVLKMKEKR